ALVPGPPAAPAKRGVLPPAGGGGGRGLPGLPPVPSEGSFACASAGGVGGGRVPAAGCARGRPPASRRPRGRTGREPAPSPAHVQAAHGNHAAPVRGRGAARVLPGASEEGGRRDGSGLRRGLRIEQQGV